MAVWITVDCDLPDHPKMAALPSDAARYGWIVVLARAKKQRQQGAFADERHFREVMGRFGRYLANYVKGGLLDRVDGSLVVHGWQQYQWAAQKARQREDIRADNPETLSRQSEDIAKTISGHQLRPTETYTSTETTVESGSDEPSSTGAIAKTSVGRAPKLLVKDMNGHATEVEVGEPMPADLVRLQKLAEELTGQAYVMSNPYGGLGRKAVEEQLGRHHWDRVEQAWRQVAQRHLGASSSPPTLRQLVLGADDLLNPIATGLDREAHEQAEQQRFDKRVQATKRRLYGEHA